MIKNLIDKLKYERNLTKEEFAFLISNISDNEKNYLYTVSRSVTNKIFNKKIYIRGLIEFTNYCKNNCYYCGIRCENKNVIRYRLSKEDILSCCNEGYTLGFRTFVLQGGEDLFFNDEKLSEIIVEIKSKYPDCAVTLSVGERSYESYKILKNSGADRFLLRHETANENHYSLLHPKNLSFENRMNCINNLKKLGYQVGIGFMVGSPYQKLSNIVEDLVYIKNFNPQMVGIGPFMPHHDTPFKNESKGSLDLTLILLSIIRLMIPNVLLPATTSLASIDPMGREMGILAGANVIMPNLSPVKNRKNYQLYDNKVSFGDEAAQSVDLLKERMKKIGYEIVTDKGDYFNI